MRHRSGIGRELKNMLRLALILILILVWAGTRPSPGNAQGPGEDVYLVKDIYPGSESSGPEYLTAADGALFFRADDGSHGEELWQSDGTAAGTALVKDIYSGLADSDPTELTSVNRMLFFRADDGTHGQELWASRLLDGILYLPVILKNF